MNMQLYGDFTGVIQSCMVGTIDGTLLHTIDTIMYILIKNDFLTIILKKKKKKKKI